MLKKWKALCLSALIAGFLLSAGFGILFRTENTRRRYLARNTHRFSRWALRILGVQFHTQGLNRGPQNCLTLANHVSYLDVLVLAALRPSLFVTSVEVKQMPFLGLMARAAGSVFVERRNRRNLREEIASLRALLESRFEVVIFPEGTTSNGDTVLPFKKSLVRCALESGVVIQPACLVYRRLNGAPLNKVTRDFLFYYGEMSFAPHLKNLLRVSSIEGTVHFLKRIGVGEASCHKSIADEAHHAISESYKRFVPAMA